MDKPPVSFSEKVRAPAGPNAGGYPTQLSASDLDRNFAACFLTADDPKVFEECIGPYGYPSRKIKGLSDLSKTATLDIQISYSAAGSETLSQYGMWMVGQTCGAGESSDAKCAPGTWQANAAPIYSHDDGIFRATEYAETSEVVTDAGPNTIVFEYRPVSKIKLVSPSTSATALVDIADLPTGSEAKFRLFTVCVDGLEKTAYILATEPADPI